MPNAAPIRPKLCARFSGVVTSATNALAGAYTAPHARERAADEQPCQVGCKAHQRVVHPECEQGEQQHGPAAEAIAEIAHHRPEHELQAREHQHAATTDARRARHIHVRSLMMSAAARE